MNQYILTIVFLNGDRKEISLETPHELQPEPRSPHALAYKDRDGDIHNIPWTSMLEFHFNPEDYMKVRKQHMESMNNQNKK